MSKYNPPTLNFDTYETPDKEIINQREVLIYRPHSDSLMFKYDNIYFEIHKMSKSKMGGRNMKIVAWMFENNGKKQYLKNNEFGTPQSITNKDWKINIPTRALADFYKKRELVVIATSVLELHKRRVDIIKGVFNI